MGLLLVTSLSRRLMPLLRYPVGDRACWVEPTATPRRKFALRGRSAWSQRVRVGVMSLLTDEIHAIIQTVADSEQWQLHLEQIDCIDHLRVNWVPDHDARAIETISRALHDELVAKYPAIKTLSDDGLLQFQVMPCATGDIRLHPLAGKRLRVVDMRVYAPGTVAGA